MSGRLMIQRFVCLALLTTLTGSAVAQPDMSEKIEQLMLLRDLENARAQADTAINKGALFLIASQSEDGSWAGDKSPGITALVLSALIEHPEIHPDHPAVERGLAYLFRFQRDDGGIYQSGGLIKSYESSVVLSLLSQFPGDAHKKRIERLQRFLKENQWDESEDISRDNVFYGGAGYGRGKRPDLSNTNVMLDALHDSGLDPNDPAYKKALIFIQRCQMLTEFNDQDYAKGATNGGFIYAPANGGESKAGTHLVDGKEQLRPYGSMTYAGFKSMLYAGLKRDDPRVRAAYDWIRAHWTLDENPNMPAAQAKEGLFYYYHTVGRALAAWGEDHLETADGKKHNWRSALTTTLTKQQRDDGSWVNDADRWMEGEPALCTAYAMRALQAAFKDTPSIKSQPVKR